MKALSEGLFGTEQT